MILLAKLRTGLDKQAYRYRLQARRPKTEFYQMLNFTIRIKKEKKKVMGRERKKKKIPECLIYDLNIK